MIVIEEIRKITEKAETKEKVEKRRIENIKIERNKRESMLKKAKKEAEEKVGKILKSLEIKILSAAENGLHKTRFYIRDIAKDDGYMGSYQDYRDEFIINYLVDKIGSNFGIKEKNRHYPNIYFGFGTERYLIVKW